MLSDEIKAILKPLPEGITLIITVGNINRSDDGIGPYIADKLKNLNRQVMILNAEDRPENIVDPALSCRPKRVVFIDSAGFNGQAGEIRLIPMDSIDNRTLSTHRIPLSIIARILENDLNCEIYFIGIQWNSLEFGNKLSEPVQYTADKITDYIQFLYMNVEN